MKRLLVGAWIVAAAGFWTTLAAQQTPGMVLSSPAFADGTDFPQHFTQHDPGHPISPTLAWTNVPAGTASFVLILHDMEVAQNKTLEDSLHWIVFNIPGTSRGLPEGVPREATLADGTIQPMNPRGHYGYRGPGAVVPPRHHYTFELYALDTRLTLGTDATRAEILKAVDGHVLGKAILMGLYNKK